MSQKSKQEKAEITLLGNVSRLLFKGELIKSGDAEKMKVGFQYREYAGFVEELYSDEWKETSTIKVSNAGIFSLKPEIKKEGKTYQFRAFVDHPKLRVYGDILRMKF